MQQCVLFFYHSTNMISSPRWWHTTGNSGTVIKRLIILFFTLTLSPSSLSIYLYFRQVCEEDCLIFILYRNLLYKSRVKFTLLAINWNGFVFILVCWELVERIGTEGIRLVGRIRRHCILIRLSFSQNLGHSHILDWIHSLHSEGKRDQTVHRVGNMKRRACSNE